MYRTATRQELIVGNYSRRVVNRVKNIAISDVKVSVCGNKFYAGRLKR